VIGSGLMLFFAVFLIFVLLFIMIYSVLSYATRDKLQIKKRLGQITELEHPEEESLENNPFLERTILPLYNSISHFLIKITPGRKMEALNKKLERAGITKNDAERWIFKKAAGISIVTILFSLLVYSIDNDLATVILFSVIIALVMNVVFNFYISKKIEKRKNGIQRDLPYILDLITVSVEAGLSFDGAIARVVNSVENDLCTEFAKSLKEMRMGIAKKIALKNMGDRCNVRELSLLITSIIQADELGVSLGNVLRIESNNLREHRKQVIREKAMKVPIKMLIPLIVFIFPSVFIIILGPAVIKIFAVFMK
jgi:tight adherence protein C